MSGGGMVTLAILAPGLGGSGASSSQRHLAFQPDGQGLVYTMVGTDGALRLVRQSLDAETPSPIPGAIGMSSPLVSPDGRWLVGTQGVSSQVELRAGGSNCDQYSLQVVEYRGAHVFASDMLGGLWKLAAVQR